MVKISRRKFSKIWSIKEPSCRNHAGKSLWSPLLKKRTFHQEISRNSLLKAYMFQRYYTRAPNQISYTCFENIGKFSERAPYWSSFLINCRCANYSLQPCVLKILANSLDNVCCRVPLCRSRHNRSSTK